MPRRTLVGTSVFVLAVALRSLVLTPVEAAPLAEPPSAADTTSGRPVPTTFGFGLQAGADLTGINGWMPNSGSPWDYAYRYIGGGMNRGGTTNWTAWAPDASFPVIYARAAAAKGYTPVFSYYSIQSAIGPCTLRIPLCSEAEGDLTNLNSPDVMSKYYRDFALLMQRLGPGSDDGVEGFGQDTIVHVEPDLSGYAQSAVLSKAKCFGFCTGVGNDPSLLKASVRSSGVADVAAFPDSYVGFNQALLALRDQYAPNVRLAFHISNWSTLYDINSATSPTLDATFLGTKAGVFAAASGVAPIVGSASTYDLVFNDVSNKDAGYYTHVLHKPRFWDATNTVFPNFHRWEEYLRAATTAAGRPAIVWQVPMGNQYFSTMNNTSGHYQDNRVDYFFNHVEELRDANIVGVLFGSTTPDATKYYDAQHDGVTNRPSFCTTDGTSGEPVCNDHTSTLRDDDGGYLRMRAQAYYADPLSL